ncbi:hypothetical protein bcgnr5378_13690 [Bacillus cereus]|nr:MULTISPECIES: hypothetical protein [Bacillus]AYF04916.1 hypothetical protein MLA2C4_04195 [Bacillus mobilis]HDR4562023.1 hypothetical protein [Bacillus luti]KYQ03152.1 hypothetical protein B4079_1632 [Bacillus cereus]MCT1379976.1 hypothetical protein [Bacillus sp. p3-SID196]MCU5470270.1 hypothetical protein [Bacillus paranthracis]
MKLNLMKIFDGYVRNYHTLNLTLYHGNHSFTMMEIEYFLRLGSMLGYYPFTEDTCNGSYRPMDLTWWDNCDGEYWYDFVLHLERENLFKKDVETLEKLFDEREQVPQNTIGIINVRNGDRVRELVKVAQKMCKVDNALLIFRTNSSDNKKSYLDEVHAYLLNKSSIIDNKKVSVIVIADTLYMNFEEIKEETVSL